MNLGLKDIFAFVGGIFTNKLMPTFFSQWASKGADVLTEKAKKAFEHPPAQDLIKVILLLNPEDRKKITDFLEKGEEQGWENEAVVTLAAILPRNEDGSLNLQEAAKALMSLAQLEPKMLGQLLEAARHNPLLQRLIHDFKHLMKFLEDQAENLGFVAGVAADALKDVDAHAKDHIQKRLTETEIRTRLRNGERVTREEPTKKAKFARLAESRFK